VAKCKQALRWANGAFLCLMCFYWSCLVFLLVGAAASGGRRGVQGKLHHLFLTGIVQLPWSCEDTIRAIDNGYCGLIVLTLFTWISVELKRRLGRSCAG
jgi:hypothetical protein